MQASVGKTRTKKTSGGAGEEVPETASRASNFEVVPGQTIRNKGERCLKGPPTVPGTERENTEGAEGRKKDITTERQHPMEALRKEIVMFLQQQGDLEKKVGSNKRKDG